MESLKELTDYEATMTTSFGSDITKAIVDICRLCQFTNSDQIGSINPFSRNITSDKKMTYRINVDHPEYTITEKSMEYIKENYNNEYLSYLIYKTVSRYMQYTFGRIDIERSLEYDEMNGLQGTVIFVVKWVMVDKLLGESPTIRRKDISSLKYIPDMVRMLYPEYK